MKNMKKRFVKCVKSENGSTTIGKEYELDENGHFTFDIGLRSFFPFDEYECVGVHFELISDELVSIVYKHDERVSETLTFEVKPDAPLYRGTLTVKESLYKALMEVTFIDSSQDAVKWLLENTISIEN
jgi:hypothetical protein